MVFLFFYGLLRSRSGCIHCKSRTGYFATSILIIFILADLCDWAVRLSFVAVMVGDLTAMVLVLTFSEKVNFLVLT